MSLLIVQHNILGSIGQKKILAIVEVDHRFHNGEVCGTDENVEPYQRPYESLVKEHHIALLIKALGKIIDGSDQLRFTTLFLLKPMLFVTQDFIIF